MSWGWAPTAVHTDRPGRGGCRCQDCLAAARARRDEVEAIEIAIARGVSTEQIVERLSVDAARVDEVLAQMVAP